jgi:hypothetical protein
VSRFSPVELAEAEVCDLLVVLTHIPKCCGTSFRYSLIDNNIPSPLVFHPKNGWRSIIMRTGDFRFLTGHFEAGIERLVTPFSPASRRKKFRVVILREPLDQMISLAAYHRELDSRQDQRKMNGDDVVRFFSTHDLLTNIQTRMVSGFFKNRIYSKTKFKVLEPILLRAAKRNLTEFYDFVGRFDRINDDLRELGRRLSFMYGDVHAEVTRTKTRMPVHALSDSQICDLRKINHLDCELYQYAMSTLWPHGGDCKNG